MQSKILAVLYIKTISVIWICNFRITLAQRHYTVHDNNTKSVIYNFTNTPTETCVEKDIDLIVSIFTIICSSISIITCATAFLMYYLVRNIPEIMKESKRHWIHWNFMASFILRDIIMLTVLTVISIYSQRRRNLSQPGIRVLTISVAYTQATNCFWMFVEGLYLLLGIILHLRLRQQKWMRLKLFLLGWGVPGIFVSIWAIQQQVTNGVFDLGAIAARIIISGPLYVVLLANLFIIIRVLYTLRGMMRLDIDHKQKSTLRTLAKRTLFLSILLGIYQLLPAFIHAITEHCLTSKIILVINTFVSSLYGFLVALLYVLLNDEVMEHAIRKLPTFLQITIGHRTLRGHSSSSSSASSCQRTKATSVSSNNNERCDKDRPSISPNPTPTASPRVSADTVWNSHLNVDPHQGVFGRYLSPGSTDIRENSEVAPDEPDYTETTFTFNSP